jgi:hypothetical protein
MERGETGAIVRTIAEKRGVSERTVWRWFKAMRQADDTNLDLLGPRVCSFCGQSLPVGSTIRRRFCNSTCRVSHYRGYPARQRIDPTTDAA